VVASLLSEFHDRGVVRLDGAFSRDQASAIRETIWSYAKKHGGWERADPTTWNPGPGGPFSWRRLRGKEVFAPLIGNDATVSALTEIFGDSGYHHPQPAAQILMTMPTPGPWVLPSAWHMDAGFETPSWPVPAVKIFAFFDDVGPEGGGTLLLPGSHRVVDRYRSRLPPGTGAGAQNWGPFMRHDPLLAELTRADRRLDHGRGLVGTTGDVDGIEVDVVELTGAPGDVVITHLHVFHAMAPNVSQRPRQMLGRAIRAVQVAGPG
jgi:hypothetical protein